MKFKILLYLEIITLFLALLNAAAPPLHWDRSFDQLVDYINSNQTLWRAGRSSDTKKTVLKPQNSTFHKHIHNWYQLPSHFDAREIWMNCSSLNHIRDQRCKSCWAVSTASAMSDRLCIHSNGRENVHLSDLDLMTCCTKFGTWCDGGVLSSAWKYGLRKGIVSGGEEGCKPDTTPMCKIIYNNNGTYTCSALENSCQRRCQPSFGKTYRNDLKKLYVAYKRHRQRSIMLDIYNNGPVTTRFRAFQDFMVYNSGIYRYLTGSYRGSHSVKLLGWGEENNVKYWLAANSWGSNWGENGFFKFVRGANHLGIENVAYTGLFKK